MEDMYNEFEFEMEEDVPEEESIETSGRGNAFRRHKERAKKSRRRKIVGFSARGDTVPDKHIFSVPLRYRNHKTKNKGKRRLRDGNYDPAKNWSLKDAKRIEAMEDDLKENEATE